MENWIILIPVALIILGILGVMYVIKLRIKEIKEMLYVCPNNGRKYMPLDRCKIKNSASEEWLDALIYQDYDSGHLYVMERKDFFDKFVKLKDWENGNSNKQGISGAD